jgi:hypothetical protein
MNVQCDVKDRLLSEYQGAVERLCESVRALKAASGNDFECTHAEVEANQDACEKARTALKEHWQKHRC